MTPAVKAAQRAKIHFTLHQYPHHPEAKSYGLEAAEKLGVAPQQVFKTLMLQADGERLMMALVPVSATLNLKKAARALEVKKIKMAESGLAERATGYVLGGISPLGQKKRHACVIDQSAQNYSSLYISGGRRGLEIALSASDLARLTGAIFADITLIG